MAILTISNSTDQALMSQISRVSELKSKSDIPALVDILLHFYEVKSQICNYELLRTQMKAYAEKVIEGLPTYILETPEETINGRVYIQNLGINFPSVRVEILRLSEDQGKYGLRMHQFSNREGVFKIFMEDTSIIKSGGNAFFSILAECIGKIRDIVGERVILDLQPSRGLEGFARTFQALNNWFVFLEEFSNVAILGFVEKSQIAVQLALSLFSGSYNFNQCLGLLNSDNPKSKKSGETNFRNNYAENYTVEVEWLLELLNGSTNN